jgi:hypothetical protein
MTVWTCVLHGVAGDVRRMQVSVRIDSKSAKLLQPGESVRLPVGAQHSVSPGIHSTTGAPSVWAYRCGDSLHPLEHPTI